MNYKLFDSRVELRKYLFQHLLDVIKSSGVRTNIALSGGSSPKWYLLPFTMNKKINWSKVFIYQVDERCVPPDDDQSNYKMLKEVLFDKADIPGENIYRIKGEGDPNEEAEAYGNILLNENIIFDVVLLGMGSDGHTASIFPGQSYSFNYKNITGVSRFPLSDQKRISLTERTINNATHKIFIVEGEDKEEKLKEIFVNNNRTDLPAGRIKGNVLWLLNKNCCKFLIK